MRVVDSIAFFSYRGNIVGHFDASKEGTPKVVNLWGRDPIRDKDILCHRECGEAVLMQFTGLHDKNGKEIYEGDVISWRSYKGECYYDNGRFWIKGFSCTWQDDPSDAFSEGEPLEVIGNVYENPELLKV